MSLYNAARPLLFHMDPERAHHLSLCLMAIAGALPPLRALLRWIYAPPLDPVEAFGLTFPNRVGLAAGYDKDALGYRGLACLGFGHIEIGTVTPRPQAGNAKPRVFRLNEDLAVINRLGFPGVGAQRVARRLHGHRPKGTILGLNIGKQKRTPLADALFDYEPLVGLFAPLADYLTINISSPNTPGLRELQRREHLEGLLKGLAEARKKQERLLERPVPLLVKISPDLDDAALEEAVGITHDAGLDGIIATNTTISRAGLTSPAADEAGGLSGRPLTAKSLAVVRRIGQLTQGKLPIISVGGIMTPDDARRRLDAGATLVQIYTGMVYAGPRLPGQIARALKGL